MLRPRILIPLVLGLALLAWLGWCLYIFLLPPHEKLLRDETVQRGLLYCEQGDASLLLDYYPGQTGMGLVIYVHGGGWRKGDRIPGESAAVMITALRDGGLNIAAIDYRQAPDHRLSDMQEDLNCAIDYLRRRSHELGFDGNNVGLLGFTTGGHLSLLTAGRRKATGQTALQAVAALYAPTNLNRPDQLWLIQPADYHDELMKLLFAEPDAARLERASPVSYAEYLDLPSLLVYGDRDQVVGPGQGMDLYWRLRLLGQPTEFILVRDSGHLTALSDNTSPDWKALSDWVTGFFNQALAAR